LGIYTIKFELEDIALKYLDPESYYKLVDLVKEKKDERQADIDKTTDDIKIALDELEIKYEISGRSKHFYSIYTKMKYQSKSLDEIFDLTAVRIIVDSVKDCYSVLGTVHTLWKPIPGRFKDYIAMPKTNRYQSIHTTVLDEKGHPFEIQIRTWAMHRIAEYGIAAHWKYKEGVSGDQEEVKLAWLRQTLEWNKDMNDPREFMEALRMDLFASQVFVFTPKGEVVELPAGSTPLDFAFKIHTDIGVKCVGAKVNAKMAPIDRRLDNGEIVEIITSNNSSGPSIDWLQIAKSSNARSKIRSWLKKQDRSQNIERGKEMLEKQAKRRGFDPHDFIRNSWLVKIAKSMKFSSTDELFTSISYGGVLVSKVLTALQEYFDTEKSVSGADKDAELLAKAEKPRRRTFTSDGAVRIEGVENPLVHLARCCSPLPGDEIIGFVTKGNGVSVHRRNCPNILSVKEADKGRLLEVAWSEQGSRGAYDADFSIVAEDRKGLFSDISHKCADMDVNITGAKLATDPDGTARIMLTLSISGKQQMEKVLRSIRQIESVTEVYRA
ncbi:MAG: RelA/SpoT family protein, partial [Clostridiales Family XIII bacterium]|nr:RelA/SpoT family protein [Clostridiales Family XIII bacterium]